MGFPNGDWQGKKERVRDCLLEKIDTERKREREGEGEGESERERGRGREREREREREEMRFYLQKKKRGQL
jgi:hypothetical protein